MTPDEVYTELVRLNQIDIPEDARNRGQDFIVEIVSKIRRGQDFCTSNLVLCKQNITLAKKIVLARQREVDIYLYNSMKERKYSEEVKSFSERKYLLELEANELIDLKGATVQLESLVYLKESLADTLTNLRTAKEELNMVLTLLKMEFKDANSGVMWNNPSTELNYQDPLSDLNLEGIK